MGKIFQQKFSYAVMKRFQLKQAILSPKIEKSPKRLSYSQVSVIHSSVIARFDCSSPDQVRPYYCISKLNTEYTA